MDLKSLPGSGRFASRSKIIVGAALAVTAVAAYLTDSDALWAVVQQLAPLLLSGS
ncbi:hypothetical protein [Azospirillum sp.]|uniref:hypothetical protein n=1 Tax=Azospirillum sp. TaxID=34012 RepID=UPI003D70A38C